MANIDSYPVKVIPTLWLKSFIVFICILLFTSALVFTEEEMNALMDRSDLVEGAQGDVKGEIAHLEGVFKRVDTPIDEMKK